MKSRLIKKIQKRPYDAEGRTIYVATISGRVRGGKWKTVKRRQVCRMESMDWSDPIMAMSGCSGDFARDFEARDREDGCPRCIEAGMP